MFGRLWTAFLSSILLFAGTADARADELTLFAIPSPKGLNWSSPSSLARTTANNFLVPDLHWSSYGLGHSAVSLQCAGRPQRFAGLRAGPQTGNFDLLMKNKIGLGILFHVYPGRLQSETELAQDLRARARSGRMSWLKFQISAKTCERLETYLREYIQLGLELRYGVHLKPRRREGGGNTSFAVSFLELAGVLSPEMRNAWERVVRVNDELIGRSRAPVGLTAILLTRAWSDVSKPHRMLAFYDPDLMFDSIVTSWKLHHKNGSPSGLTLEKNGRAVGLVIDSRQVPTPTDPIWKQ